MLQLHRSSLFKTAKKINRFQNCHNSCIEPSSLSQPLCNTLRDSKRYVCDMSIGIFRLPYETYPTRILFIERYIHMLTYSILAYAYLEPCW